MLVIEPGAAVSGSKNADHCAVLPLLTGTFHQVIRVVQSDELPTQLEVSWYSGPDDDASSLLQVDHVRSFSGFFQVSIVSREYDRLDWSA